MHAAVGQQVGRETVVSGRRDYLYVEHILQRFCRYIRRGVFLEKHSLLDKQQQQQFAAQCSAAATSTFS